MKHYIYKVSSPNGKFYIGRHSTAKNNDNYIGSGKWVRSIKDKSILSKIILEYCESFEKLLEREEYYINQFIDDPLNMNFNNKPIGASTGDRNHQHRPELKEKNRKRMTENNPMKKGHSEETKLLLKELFSGKNNPFYGKSHTAETKKIMRNKKLGIPLSEDHKKTLSEVRKGKTPKCSFKGKTHKQESLDKMKEIALQRERKTCKYCDGVFAVNTYSRWHGEKCPKNTSIIARQRQSCPESPGWG